MTATRPPGYDDRSAAPVEASRRGAHRARPKAIAAILPVIAGVAVVLLVIGGVYTVVGGRSDSSSSSASGRETLDEEGADPSAAPSAADGKDGKNDKGADAGDEPTATPGADGGQGAGAGNGGGSKVDKSIPLVVLNSLNVNGLAGQYQGDLEGKGWTVERIDGSKQKDLAVTKIYYPEADMKPTANAVRKALGGLGELAEDADVNPGNITVVLGQDTQ